MEPVAKNAPPKRWLSTLCSNLSGNQTVEEVQAILDGLDASLLADNQVESVLRQLHSATNHKRLLELVLACKSLSSSLTMFPVNCLPKVGVGLIVFQLGC